MYSFAAELAVDGTSTELPSAFAPFLEQQFFENNVVQPDFHGQMWNPGRLFSIEHDTSTKYQYGTAARMENGGCNVCSGHLTTTAGCSVA